MSRMRPFHSTIPLEEARGQIEHAIRPLDRTETLPLTHAGGRVLAVTVTAGTDVPPFDRAGMDGYAVRAADTAGASADTPKTLACIGRVFTGEVTSAVVGPGQCLEIATGAPLPAGADAVVMVEQTHEAGTGQIEMLSPVQPRQHVGRQGADIARGHTALQSGDYLNPSRVGALAALGLGEVTVFAQPRVAILSTGNEVVEPGQALAPGQIYDINRYTLSGIVTANGGIPDARRATADALDALLSAIDGCADADVLVFSGGSSVGTRDLVTDALQNRGRMLFHGVAVKPGKPTAFGLIDGRPCFGMPGYPASCLSNGYVLLAPALRRMARLRSDAGLRIAVPLSKDITSTATRHQFYTVRIEAGTAQPAFKASGDITSLSRADGYIEIPVGVASIDAGTIVDVRLF